MLINYLKKIFFVLVLISSVGSFADYKKPIEWNGNIYKIINDYSKIQKEFYQQVCVPNDLVKYDRLIRKYRGQGYYLPKVGDDIDRNAIIKNLHFLRKKIKFLKSTVEELSKSKDFLKFSLAKDEVDKIVENLLSLKKQYHLEIKNKAKERILQESRLQIRLLKKQFSLFMDQMYFMKSFNFPNDFLSLRRDYEKFRFDKKHIDDKKANEIFFYRKIVEDGAYDPNKSSPDKFIRTALDTLYLNIQKESDFISEDVRYDLEWLENKLEKIVERGKDVQLERLKEWLERTESNFKFYQELIATKNKKNAKFLVQKENEAADDLRQFVYSKQAEVYSYWAKKDALMKALFVFETILVHEVGVIDGEHGLERKNVAMVVLNRYNDEFYSQLDPNQPIVEFIPKGLDHEKEKWLNVLFKIGEFSFTYHYIPAVTGIYCPDMSRRGRSIRSKNLKIALKAIKEHDGFFNAYRYFSRVSMLGKIDMSTVWDVNYERLPEMPGYKSPGQVRLIHRYYADSYQYFYSFRDARDIEYTVLKIGSDIYSMTWKKGKPEFYDYRNPHYFKYFSKKKKL